MPYCHTWATGVRSPTKAEDFSCTLCVQTGSGAHPASCKMGTGGSFPGAWCERGVMLTTHSHLVLWVKKQRGYTSSPRMRQKWRVTGNCYLFAIIQVSSTNAILRQGRTQKNGVRLQCVFRRHIVSASGERISWL
jgi:hypothetical protein